MRDLLSLSGVLFRGCSDSWLFTVLVPGSFVRNVQMPPPKRETRGKQFVASGEKKLPSSPRSNCTGSSACLKEPAFESGIGFGALYMLISSQQELQRLNILLEQTEALVQQMKRHLQHHGRKLKHCSCSKCPNTYLTDIKTVSDQGSLNYNDQEGSLQKYNHMRNARDLRRLEDHDLTAEVIVTEEMVENCEMSALEVELEAELELLELNLNITDSCPEEAVVYNSCEGVCKEVMDVLHNDKISHKMHDTSDSDMRSRQSTQLVALSAGYAVSPLELDRRLREVLEAQQNERILELEELLRETKTTLHAKEEEILYWKNCVHELTMSFQPSSAAGTDIPRFNDFSSHADHLYNKPEFTKNSLKRLGTLQDPPIFSQTNQVQNLNSSFSLAETSKQRKFLSSSAIDGTLQSNKFPLYISELSNSINLEESVDFVKVVTESHTSWHIQGAGIETPETADRSMGEIEVHTPLPMIPKSFRGQSVSRASERSDYFQQDDLNSVTSPSCWDFCEQGNSAIANPNNACLQYTKNISDSCSSKDMSCPEQKDSARTEAMSDVHVDLCLEPLKPVLKGSSSKYQGLEDPLPGCIDSKFMAVEEINSSDPKETVNSGMSDLHFNTMKRLHSVPQSPPHLAAKSARGNSKKKNEDLQIVTTGLRRSFNAKESSIGITSPVLGKIRQWEALGKGQALENCTSDIIKTGNDGKNVWNE